jgi:hypothetical protein
MGNLLKTKQKPMNLPGKTNMQRDITSFQLAPGHTIWHIEHNSIAPGYFQYKKEARKIKSYLFMIK